MNKPSKRTVFYIVLFTLIVTKVGGAKKKLTVTPSIHSNVVTEEHWTSSCAVVEEGVPVCQDPVDDVEPIDDVNLSKTRTPYPENGFVLLQDLGRGRRPPTTGRTWQWLWRQWHDYDDSDSVQDNRVEVLEENDQEELTSVDYYDDAGPRTVITYMIKGCSPSKVPNDLTPCSARENNGAFLQGSADRITSTRVIYYLPPSSTPAKSSDDYDYWPCIYYINC